MFRKARFLGAALLISTGLFAAEDVKVVRIEGPRALSRLAWEELTPNFGLAVTYEEGPYVGADLRIVLQPRGGRPETWVRAQPIEFHLPLATATHAASVTANSSTEPVAAPFPNSDLLEAAVSQYNSSGNPGRFKLMYRWGYAHIIPTGHWGKDQTQDFEPLFSTTVSVHTGWVTCAEALHNLLSQISQGRGVRIEEGVVPFTALLRPESCSIDMDAPARDVLIFLLAQLGTDRRFPGFPSSRFAWALHYDANTEAYYLNLRGLPEPLRLYKPNQATAPPSQDSAPFGGKTGKIVKP